MSDLSERPTSADFTTSTAILDLSSGGPSCALSVRPIRLPSEVNSQPSGRISRLACKVNSLSLMDSHFAGPPTFASPLHEATTTTTTTIEDNMVPAKSFTNAQIPTANGEDTPWYRFCRPAAPVPPILGGSSSGSFENTTDSPSGCRGNSSPMDAFTETHVDQENLAHAPLERSLLESPSFGQPLTLVSNILQSPVIFGERLPKWSVLRRPDSNPIPHRPAFSERNTTTTPSSEVSSASPRDSPQTPPVFIFGRRSSCFTSLAAPGLTRPTVLKGNPSDTRAPDAHANKRTASNGRQLGDDFSVKKIRIHSLVPSEHSAFLPVPHSNKNSEVSAGFVLSRDFEMPSGSI